MTAARARPARPEGSTIQTVVALAFVSAPSTEALSQALSQHDSLRHRYPRSQQLASVTLSVNPGLMVSGGGAPEVSGFTFDYIEPDGTVARALVCTDNAVHIHRTDSSDSDQVQREVQEEFELVLPILGGDVANIAMEQLDRFVWDGTRRDFRAASVFRKDNGWLAPKIFGARDMWHSNHGLFAFEDKPHTHRVLHTVEVHTRPANEAVSTGSGTTIVVDVKQKLQVAHGMRQPEDQAQILTTADLLGGEGEQGLLSQYMSYMLTRTETLLSNLVNDDVRS